MAASYTIFNVAVNAGSIKGITRQSFDRRLEALLPGASGSVDPTFAAKRAELPLADFDTMHIDEALTACGISGLAVSTSIALAFQQFSYGGTRAGATSHVKATFNEGLMIPARIRATMNGPAIATYEVYASDSDGAGGVTISTGQTLSGDQETTEAFLVGPLKVGATTYQLTDLDVDFNISLLVARASGNLLPLGLAINERSNIVVRGRCTDMDALAVTGTDLSSSNLVFFLRAISSGGAPVADATASHIKFTATKGIVVAERAEGSQGGEAGVDLICRLAYDKTNAILQVATSQAIA